MNIERSTSIGHLREIAQEVDGKFNAGGKIQQATTSFIGKVFSLGVKIFSMSQRIFGSKKNVQAGGDVTPKLLDFSGGNFELNENNAQSFGNSLKTNGAKFIVNQLTDKEIFGLINSKFLSIPQKMQICEAYKGRNKVSLEYLLAEALNKKLAPLGFNKDTIAKFFGILPDPQKFSDYMLDIFTNTPLATLPGVLDFFGPEGVFPLQDLPKGHLETLLAQIEAMPLDKRLEEIISVAEEDLIDKWEGYEHEDALEKLDQFKKEASKIVPGFLGLKYALEVTLKKSSAKKVKDEIRIVKNCIKHGQEQSLLTSGLYAEFTKACINSINSPQNPSEASAIFSEVEQVFSKLITPKLTTSKEKLTAPKQMSIEEALDQVFSKEDSYDFVIGDLSKKVDKNQAKKYFQDIENPKDQRFFLEEFMKFCILNDLDPKPILSRYPKATAKIILEKFDTLSKPAELEKIQKLFPFIEQLTELREKFSDEKDEERANKIANAVERKLEEYNTQLADLKKVSETAVNTSAESFIEDEGVSIAERNTAREALEQIFAQAAPFGKSNVKREDLLKLEQELQSQGLQTRKDAISKLIKMCALEELDPSPVLSLYPKTTFEVILEKFDTLQKDFGSPEWVDALELLNTVYLKFKESFSGNDLLIINPVFLKIDQELLPLTINLRKLVKALDDIPEGEQLEADKIAGEIEETNKQFITAFNTHKAEIREAFETAVAEMHWTV